jgi:glycosyltransferase involved in cell wall biosynthesis
MTLRNVHYLGWRPYDTLPAYMKAMDVCLMPYRLNEWMRNAHLNKTYQYLAAGKPVVSTAFPEVIRLEKVISVAKHTEDFIAAVEKALNRTDTTQDIADRLEIARQNSSTVRAQQRAVMLAEMLVATKEKG